MGVEWIGARHTARAGVAPFLPVAQSVEVSRGRVSTMGRAGKTMK